MRAIIASTLLAAFMLLASPATAAVSTPLTRFQDAQAIVAADTIAMRTAITKWGQDDAAVVEVESALLKFKTDLVALTVDDCFAEWWADEYGFVSILYSAVQNIVASGGSDVDTALINAGGFLFRQADQDILTADCGDHFPTDVA